MSAGAYEDDGDAIIEMDLLPPRWLDVQDEVTEYLSDIATQTRKLDDLHQKHILPGFDDEDVKKREEREIERLTQIITRKFQGCQKSIHRIDVMVQESRDQGARSRGEETMAMNLKISLATRVGEASALFRKKQSAYLKSESAFSVSTLIIPNGVLCRTESHWWLCFPHWRHFNARSKPLQRSCSYGI
jgi:syntaxin 16